jgi:hypothetical protein
MVPFYFGGGHCDSRRISLPCFRAGCIYVFMGIFLKSANGEKAACRTHMQSQ